MLAVGAHPTWRVVRGGSHSYIPRLIAPLGEAVHLGAHLRVGLARRRRRDADLRRSAGAAGRRGGLRLPRRSGAAAAGRRRATSSATCLGRVHDDSERRVAAHRRGFAAAAAAARASWNYRLGAEADAAADVTYDLNRLQRIPAPTTYCVTLNPRQAIAPESRHRPLYLPPPALSRSNRSRAQARWREVSGVRPHPLLRRLLALRLPRGRAGLGDSRRRAILGSSGDSDRARPLRRHAPPSTASRRARTSSRTRCSWRCSTSTACAEAMAVSRLTSYNRFNWASFRRPRPSRRSVAAAARPPGAERGQSRGRRCPTGPIYLLTHLRYAGYVSIRSRSTTATTSDGALRSVLADVRNTYGGRRDYWLRPADASPRPVRARARRSRSTSRRSWTHDVDYEFVLTPPAAALVAHMNVTRRDGTRRARCSTRRLTLERRPWTARRRFAARCAGFPWMTAKVIAAIHWQALRLWLKGAPVVPLAEDNAIMIDQAVERWAERAVLSALERDPRRRARRRAARRPPRVTAAPAQNRRRRCLIHDRRFFRRAVARRRDRSRRQLHGRRLDDARPRRPRSPHAGQSARARPVCPPGVRWCRGYSSALAHRRRDNTRDRQPPQHPRALRPRQRVLPAVPRPEPALLVRALRGSRTTRSRRRRSTSCGQSATSSHSAPATTCSRSARGWGGFALFAATRYGCRVTTTTISGEQHAYAARPVRARRQRRPAHRPAVRGLPRPARPLRQDRQHRDVRGGRPRALRRLLRRLRAAAARPDGAMLLQTITVDDWRFA